MGIAYEMGPATGRWRGEARWYVLDPPYQRQRWRWDDDEEGYVDVTHPYVIASAAITPDHGDETYVFPANADGTVADWGELPGSERGILDHEQVIANMGYVVSKDADKGRSIIEGGNA